MGHIVAAFDDEGEEFVMDPERKDNTSGRAAVECAQVVAYFETLMDEIFAEVGLSAEALQEVDRLAHDARYHALTTLGQSALAAIPFFTQQQVMGSVWTVLQGVYRPPAIAFDPSQQSSSPNERPASNERPTSPCPSGCSSCSSDQASSSVEFHR